MGLSHYPSAAEGMLPVLVMNTVLSVALLKNLLRSVLQVMCGCIQNTQNSGEESIAYEQYQDDDSNNNKSRRESRRIKVTLFKSLCSERPSSVAITSSLVECCVCLHRFEAEEEVSELSCNHFFHKGCLEKWLDHKNSTCPLCRSTL